MQVKRVGIRWPRLWSRKTIFHAKNLWKVGLAEKKEKKGKKKEKARGYMGSKLVYKQVGLHPANHSSVLLGLNLQLQPRIVIGILTVRMSVLGGLSFALSFILCFSW